MTEQLTGEPDVLVDEWWSAWKEHGDTKARDSLILHYTPLVKFVVGRLRAGMPGHVDQADLLSDGVLGLMDAVDKFEPDRGLKFQTYAAARIRGATMDGIRSADWVPRAVREKIRAVEGARATVERRVSRVPSDDEVAAELEVPVTELRAMYRDASYTRVASIDALELHGVTVSEPGNPAATLPPDLLPAVRRLPERDQVVVALYYWEHFTLAEIGRVLGVSESRISQLHTRATATLRRELVGGGSLLDRDAGQGQSDRET